MPTREKKASNEENGENLHEFDIDILPVDEAQRYKQAAVGSEQLKSYMALLKTEHAAWSVREDKDQIFAVGKDVVVQFPVAGGGPHSVYTVRFNRSSDQILDTRGTLYSQGDDGKVTAKVFVNDKIRCDLSISEAGEMLQTRVFDSSGKEVKIEGLDAGIQGIRWKCLSKCLASAGISNTVIAAAGVACAVICGATFGLGCVACLSGVSYGIGYVAGRCVRRCS